MYLHEVYLSLPSTPSYARVCTSKEAPVCVSSHVDAPCDVHVSHVPLHVQARECVQPKCTPVWTRPILQVQVTVLTCQYPGVMTGMGREKEGREEPPPPTPASTDLHREVVGLCLGPRPLQGLPLLLK